MTNENDPGRVVVSDQPIADFSHLMSLDDDIAAWAATVRLPDAEAAAIFQRIVGSPAPAPPVTPRLDPSWWRNFTADFTTRMVSSTRPGRQAA